MKRLLCRGKERFRSRGGQTFILVMTVTALATVLGVMAMSAALMSVRLRGMKRLSDKNFYRLELAMEEIRAGVLGDVEYAAQTGGADWRTVFLTDSVGLVDLSMLTEDHALRLNSRQEAVREDAATYLEAFSLTIPAEGSAKPGEEKTEEVSVRVGDVRLDGMADAIVLSDVQFILINYERDAQTEIACDLVLTAPAAGRSLLDEVVRVDNWRRIG